MFLDFFTLRYFLLETLSLMKGGRERRYSLSTVPHTCKSSTRSHSRDKTRPTAIIPDFTWRKDWHGAACSTWKRTLVVSKSVWTSTCFSDECSSMYRSFKCSELRRSTSLLWFSGLNPHAFGRPGQYALGGNKAHTSV